MKSITIKARLIFAIGFLSILMIAIGSGGIYSLASVNSSLKTVYEDRLVAMGQLDRVIRLINRNQLTLSMAVTGNPAEIDAELKKVADNSDEIDKVWKQYAATYMTPDESALAAKFQEARTNFAEKGIAPVVKALQEKNIAAATEQLHGSMARVYLQVREPMNSLIALQLDVGKKEYEVSQLQYAQFKWLSIGAILVGLLGAAVVGFRLVRSISRPLNYAVQIAERVAAGDLTQKIEVTSKDETGQLLGALKVMNESLVNAVGSVRSSSDMIDTATSEIAAGNLELSSRTEQQAASLEETAASMEELTSTVKQNADNARQAGTLVRSASEFATEGGKVVGNVVQTMGAIRDSSSRVVDIIGVIDSIAFQTNILALNAAVEAARAGEQGRGFAVVASEVRILAQRSATAAKEIKILISESVSQVDNGSKLVDEAGAVMQKIVTSVTEVADIMTEIAAAGKEQSIGIELINEAMTQMDQVTQQNAALVEEAAAAAASLEEQARILTDAVSVFQLTANSAPARSASVSAISHARPQQRRQLGNWRPQVQIA